MSVIINSFGFFGILISRIMRLITILCLTFSVGTACAQQTDHGVSQLQPAPAAFVPPLLSQADIDRAVAQLDSIIASVMKRTGVPGVAVAVVIKDETLYAKGF